ncbi:unnamed protein product [Clavelina lepadiformis]|uniref:Uncharacterized protein n=1 Tax=Clavelina lepadiformis TaxID=159417 RepID=A0ABP0GS52_CLALP
MFSLVFLFSPFPQSSYAVLFSLSSPHSFAQRAPTISDDALSDVLQYLQHLSTLLAHHWQSSSLANYPSLAILLSFALAVLNPFVCSWPLLLSRYCEGGSIVPTFSYGFTSDEFRT